MSTPVSTTSKLRPDQALVALGANLPSPVGPPDETLRAALAALQALSSGPVLSSSLISTAPVNCAPGTPDFRNGVALISLHDQPPPERLLASLQGIEERLGRQRGARVNAPRTLDLDLICYGERVLQSALLTLPHPRAHERAFVLGPLAEIMPDLILPGQTLTVDRLLSRLSD